MNSALFLYTLFTGTELYFVAYATISRVVIAGLD